MKNDLDGLRLLGGSMRALRGDFFTKKHMNKRKLYGLHSFSQIIRIVMLLPNKQQTV